MVKCLWPFQNRPKSIWNDRNHATFRRSALRRPGRAGWLRRRPRTGGRVEVCTIQPVPALVEPRTFARALAIPTPPPPPWWMTRGTAVARDE